MKTNGDKTILIKPVELFGLRNEGITIKILLDQIIERLEKQRSNLLKRSIRHGFSSLES